ncbi:hypothetical protein D9611_006127 [Ephemerocybe angulata]|uniref:Uncharacterized protein n=1 Tax=Ephemerocybe angulata TaxID=980116 RepID=A0A8H5CG83_9AGAR|nr:hypothetical protein D9611_006127 [Tulosesus angulatus]
MFPFLQGEYRNILRPERYPRLWVVPALTKYCFGHARAQYLRKKKKAEAESSEDEEEEYLDEDGEANSGAPAANRDDEDEDDEDENDKDSVPPPLHDEDVSNSGREIEDNEGSGAVTGAAALELLLAQYPDLGAKLLSSITSGGSGSGEKSRPGARPVPKPKRPASDSSSSEEKGSKKRRIDNDDIYEESPKQQLGRRLSRRIVESDEED